MIKFEHVVCDLCGNKDYTTRYKKPDTWLWLNQFEFPIVECKGCHLVYVNPRPDAESMAHYYPVDYHAGRDTAEHLLRYRRQTEYIAKLTNEKVLDIGCARGDFLNFLIKKYPEIKAHGVDFFSRGVAFEGIEFQKADLIECHYPEGYFDLVTSWAVFEHLHTPLRYFSEVSRILKSEGKFIFLVTNSESLYGRKSYKEDIPRHTYHYSEETLKKYAEKTGFKVNRFHYESRFWDSTGKDTFYYLFQKWAGVSWENRYYQRYNRFQKIMTYLGTCVDKIIFSSQWEVTLKRSGIVIAEFEKI